MRYKLLGKSGLRVSEFCLGTMTFGETWGWGASQEESRKQFDLFDELGGNFVDTSINYTDGTAETFLGEFLKGRRERFVVASKYSLTRPDSRDPNSGGNSRKNMRQSVERSLKRLQTDYLDLFYLHAWDFMTPVEEALRGLDDLVRQGKVTYVGISDTPDWIVAEGNAIAELRGWSCFLAVQGPYSLLERDLDRAMIPMANHWGMAVLTWGVLRSGILTGKFLTKPEGATRVNPNHKLSERENQIVMEVKRIAEETGRSMSQVAINWVHQQDRAQFIPLLGARTAEQLRDNLAAGEWKLSTEQLARLEEVSQIDLGFPNDFLPGNPFIFGATFQEIDG